jgi:hypothetical protein
MLDFIALHPRQEALTDPPRSYRPPARPALNIAPRHSPRRFQNGHGADSASDIRVTQRGQEDCGHRPGLATAVRETGFVTGGVLKKGGVASSIGVR